MNENFEILLSDSSQTFFKTFSLEDPQKLILKYHHTQPDIKLLAHQIKARQKHKTKLPSWQSNHRLIFPNTISSEQSSSEVTALYKSRIINSGKMMLDLTGGMGIDFIALSKKFKLSTYVEENLEGIGSTGCIGGAQNHHPVVHSHHLK